ncbi:MAG TPA: GGDEF domain-containing protein [Rubrivivax sp.]|nr:GGDEF domain-containing protein [Rubrivivax sp.]
MRLRLEQWAFTLVVYTCYTLLAGLSWVWGDVGGLQLAIWSITMYAGELAFYALIRSGFSLRLKDPALTREQILFGIATAAAGYLFTGPYRSAVLFSLLLTLMFGAFSLSGATMLRLTAVSLACMVIAAMVRSNGVPDRVDLFNIGTLLFVLPGISVLSVRLGRMRTKLLQHKASLEDAYARIQRLSVRDELTGLLNRRHLNTALESQQLNVDRGGASACVAMLDIDHFKQINDTYGHAGGDVVLKSFARLGEQNFRGIDLVARWGGEEFLVLMPHTAMDSAVRALQRLLVAVKAQSYPSLDPDLRITISIGVACFKPGESVTGLVERADRALYAAKIGGRNRLVIAGPNSQSASDSIRNSTPVRIQSTA